MRTSYIMRLKHRTCWKNKRKWFLIQLSQIMGTLYFLVFEINSPGKAIKWWQKVCTLFKVHSFSSCSRSRLGPEVGWHPPLLEQVVIVGACRDLNRATFNRDEKWGCMNDGRRQLARRLFKTHQTIVVNDTHDANVETELTPIIANRKKY